METNPMAALVSLQCPACGGKLKIAQNVTSIACQYCGTEHLVKHETNGPILLEAYARCPVCGRNDKVEKVSAVIASQSHEITGVEQKTEQITNAQGLRQTIIRDVPFTRRQISILGQRLVAPTPPDLSTFPPFPQAPRPASKRAGIALVVIGALLVISALCCGLFGISMFFQPNNFNLFSGISEVTWIGLVSTGTAALLFLLGCGLIAIGIILTTRAGRPNLLRNRQYQDQVELIERQHARIHKGYDDAVSRWTHLYYCGRDDCVFIPGENTSALVSKIMEYLTKVEPNSKPG